MSVYVFTGPTLSPEAARQELDAVYLPPVSQGDVYRVALERPRAIGIIDGYFERMPSVWHKEIMWAMTQGIHVYGSASMGALRAAELEVFGMTGVGEIFEAYRDGRLEDDDEVAVAHAYAEAGFMPVSEAMINIRYTLRAAVSAGALSRATKVVVEEIAKKLFYPERSYGRILEEALRRGLPRTELHGFREWLRHGQVNQKRHDALAMLRRMREDLSAGLEPKRVDFALEHTSAWDHLMVLGGAAAPTGEGGRAMVNTSLLIDELRLHGPSYRRVFRSAALRHLALAEARRRHLTPDPDTLKRISDEWRRARGLSEADDVAAWLARNNLAPERLDQLLEEEALVETISASIEWEVVGRLADQLRLSGEYTGLLERAREKQDLLESRGLKEPALDECGLTADSLLSWYFERLGQPVPDHVKRYARSAGFGDEDAFIRALLREFCYVLAGPDERAVPGGVGTGSSDGGERYRACGAPP